MLILISTAPNNGTQKSIDPSDPSARHQWNDKGQIPHTMTYRVQQKHAPRPQVLDMIWQNMTTYILLNQNDTVFHSFSLQHVDVHTQKVWLKPCFLYTPTTHHHDFAHEFTFFLFVIKLIPPSILGILHQIPYDRHWWTMNLSAFPSIPIWGFP